MTLNGLPRPPDNKYLTMFIFLYLLPFYLPRFSLHILLIVLFFFVGIVRNIDPVKRLLYVLTPQTLDSLRQVNTLLKGNLEIPAVMLLSVSTGNSFFL